MSGNVYAIFENDPLNGAINLYLQCFGVIICYWNFKTFNNIIQNLCYLITVNFLILKKKYFSGDNLKFDSNCAIMFCVKLKYYWWLDSNTEMN